MVCVYIIKRAEMQFHCENKCFQRFGVSHCCGFISSSYHADFWKKSWKPVSKTFHEASKPLFQVTCLLEAFLWWVWNDFGRLNRYPRRSIACPQGLQKCLPSSVGSQKADKINVEASVDASGMDFALFWIAETLQNRCWSSSRLLRNGWGLISGYYLACKIKPKERLSLELWSACRHPPNALKVKIRIPSRHLFLRTSQRLKEGCPPHPTLRLAVESLHGFRV